MPEQAVVVGGGFFGVALALHLARRREVRVTLLEAGDQLLNRSSRVNQARVHHGYHYPRSYLTAYRSRQSFPRFVQDYPDAIRRDFRSLYAIARHGSRVSAAGFLRFCRDIGAPISPAGADLTCLFDRKRTEAVFLTEEYTFDASVLRTQAQAELQQAGVQVRLNTTARNVTRQGPRLSIDLTTLGRPNTEPLPADTVINVTYSALNALQPEGQHIALKHELAEIALIRMPQALAGLGVTVMDGPFFSALPYPTRELHSLTHVRYTPHQRWEHGQTPPADILEQPRTSLAEHMKRDAARFLPAIEDAQTIDSLYEIKTVLASTEHDDARPILWRSDPQRPGYHAVLGAKLDNVYDLLDTLDRLVPAATGAA